MKYEPLVKRLEEKHHPQLRFSNCLFVSEDLALLILDALPSHSVTTAKTPQTENGGAIRETNHYVTIVREPNGRLVALDATRPTYDEKGDFWKFEATSERELMVALSKHYGGDWEVQPKWLHQVPDWYKGFP